MSAALVEVTQADRAFAAEMAAITELREVILDGRFDGHPYVELAVRIRLEATQSLTARIAELEAENGRLREGLKRIGLLGLHNEQFPSDQAVWGEMATISRATLTETSDDR